MNDAASNFGPESYHWTDSFEHGWINAYRLGKVRDDATVETINEVEDRLIEGHVISKITDERVIMREHGEQTLFGHLLVLALTGLLTAGAGNIVYWYFRKYMRGEKTIIHRDHDTEQTEA